MFTVHANNIFKHKTIHCITNEQLIQHQYLDTSI